MTLITNPEFMAMSADPILWIVLALAVFALVWPAIVRAVERHCRNR